MGFPKGMMCEERGELTLQKCFSLGELGLFPSTGEFAHGLALNTSSHEHSSGETT